MKLGNMLEPPYSTPGADMASKPEWLINSIKEKIEHFEGSRKWYRSLTRFVAISILGLGAVTTVLIGLQQSESISPELRNICNIAALVFSAAGSFLAGVEVFYESKRLWVSNTATLNSLYALKDKYFFMQARGMLDENLLDSIFADLQEVLSTANKSWGELRTTKREGGAS